MFVCDNFNKLPYSLRLQGDNTFLVTVASMHEQTEEQMVSRREGGREASHQKHLKKIQKIQNLQLVDLRNLATREG